MTVTLSSIPRLQLANSDNRAKCSNKSHWMMFWKLDYDAANRDLGCNGKQLGLYTVKPT